MKQLSIGGQLQVILSVGALVWGVWLILPLRTFETASTYRLLDAIAAEQIWGAAVVLLASASLYTAMRHSYRWQRRALLTLAAWWLLVSILFAESNLAGTGTVAYPIIASVCAYAYHLVGVYAQ